MNVRFYKSAGGTEPVRDYLRALPTEDRAIVGASIRMIQTHGILASGVAHRQLRGKLWELKIDAQRVLYVLLSGPEMVLLHAFRKQSKKAPKGEIDTAEKRMTEVLKKE
jgi:phage-related protein